MNSDSKAPVFLSSTAPKLLLFGGKGGTGKTSCAAATALSRAARYPSENILLVSTDPAHSLRDVFAGLPVPSNLEIVEFDALAYLEEFRRQNGPKFLEIADRGTFLDKEDISRFLELSMPGLDELFAFLEIYRWANESRYGRVIVDTAPTGHTLRLLSMPRLFEGWIGALDSLLAKHRFMRKVFRGFYQPDELDEFISGLAESVGNMEEMLRDPSRCAFVTVSLAENMVVLETSRLLANLDSLGIMAHDLIVNRIFPQSVCPTCSAVRKKQSEILENLPPELTRRAIWLLPLVPEEVRGALLPRFLIAMSRFSSAHTAKISDTDLRSRLHLHRKRRHSDQHWPVNASAHQHERECVLLNAKEYESPASEHLPVKPVKNPALLPSPGTRLLLFAGKGGVGKTTLASATAVRLAHDEPGKKVLLFSTDPAHSVSDALGMVIGPSPVPVTPNLFAMEIDPEPEFSALKESYQLELHEFFDTFLRNMDITFDREVMERIMDLSPPGLDEIMALSRMTDLFEAGDYDLVVLDTSPTGHLIRLLELPETLDRWIKAFFELFLKYRNIFRLPRMSERLVLLSKSLKQLRSTLRDSTRASIHAVTIPTEMAAEETSDLINACNRTGIAVPVLFINLVTPPAPCPFCSRLIQAESNVIDRISRRFSDKVLTIIHRQIEPQGLKLLEKLGYSLYEDNRGLPPDFIRMDT